MKKPTIAIIGYGRFGRCLAELLGKDFSVSVYAHTLVSRRQASQDGIERVSMAMAARADYIYLCVPISEFDKVVKRLAPKRAPGSIVIDTCSVKLHPQSVLQKWIPPDQFILMHPLFGPDSLMSGPQGLNVVICPQPQAKSAVLFWKRYWKSRGFAVIEISADEHDKQAAYSLGVTHFIGRVMAEIAERPPQVSTKGYEALLQIVAQTNNDSWELFCDLERYNPYTKLMRGQLYHAISKLEAKMDRAIDRKGLK